MSKITFKPVADAPGVFISEPTESCQGYRFRAMVHGQTALLTADGKTPDLVVSRTKNPGFDVLAFSLSGIWDAAEDLASRAWDKISDVLTDDGGGGARIPVSSDEAEIVTTTRAPAPFSPQI
ncbi:MULTISPECIES: hypothetical protein [unclassified Arthrobacter]|uniref:hypothetical protein n=1 Tax=unclassified Arthrobacter TaxID=235627 RepID=UPI001E5EFF34|nr:hypothetical protein [Arthrobacter sp. Bi26]